MPAMPEDSTDKFANGNNDLGPGNAEQEEAIAGEDYSQEDSDGEPALMISNAQADAAGMTGAMPGDKFTLNVTVATQADDGWNIQLDPGSAVKMEAPSMDGKMGNSTVKGPGDFDIPTGLGQSPSILNT